MTQKTTGTCQVVKIREKGYALKVNDNWYGSFSGQPNCNKGDTVEIDWNLSKDGNFKNISEVKLVSSSVFNPKEAREDKAELMQLSYCKDILNTLIMHKPSGDVLEMAKLAARCIKLIKIELGGTDGYHEQRQEDITKIV